MGRGGVGRLRNKEDLELCKHKTDIGNMLPNQFSQFGCLAALLINFFPHHARSNPLDLFPSVIIHEDDGLLGEYELQVNDCLFQVTEYVPSRSRPRWILKTSFAISYYDTSTNRVNAPYSDGRLTTRHTVVWFADGSSDIDLERVNSLLRDARLSLAERQNNNTVAAREKQVRLKELLAVIEAGEFGEFAAQNHAVAYNVEGSVPEITRVSVIRAFQLPVERDDALKLITEMDNYRINNCSEN